MAGRDWLRHGDVDKILGANIFLLAISLFYPVLTFRPSGSSMFSFCFSIGLKTQLVFVKVLFSFYRKTTHPTVMRMTSRLALTETHDRNLVGTIYTTLHAS